ncbi:MAG: flagellar biosynthetic protein FliO [Lachnospiraceae bacterium]|nr:flagellar biosynthetic protein FliO [Lachnospiraceae bacterium]
MIIAQTGGIYSVTRLITVILLFIFVLGITYVTSRYVASFQKKFMGSHNIEVIEGVRLGQGSVLEIVKVGNRYLLLSVSKDGARFIAELDEKDITLKEASSEQQDFSNILKKAAVNVLSKKKDDGDK